MGFKHLKSAFSNIELSSFDSNLEHKSRSKLIPNMDKLGGGINTLLYNVSNIEFSSQKSDGNDLMYEIHRTFVPGFTSKFNPTGDSFGEGKQGNSEFVDIDTKYDLPLSRMNTYSRGSSWGGESGPTIDLENSSWFFAKNQKRSKPQGPLEITSHRLGQGDLIFETLYTHL